MTRGTSSSQVGLFSTQISEQIVRLRALSRGQDGPSEAHQVDLRRAVMATRLLAGSARILQLDVLQTFLEELLEWLQTMEQSKAPLNTTQALILESVVELEESLMIHLDEVDQETGADLSPFEGQVDDLLTLIRHNAEKIEGDAPSEDVVDDSGDDADDEPDDAPHESAGPDALDDVADWFAQAIDDAATSAELEELLALLDPGLTRLEALQSTLRDRIDALAPGLDPGPVAEGLDPVTDPTDDPVFGAATRVLRERVEALGASVHVEGFGDASELAEGMHPRVAEIVEHLAADIAAAVEAASADEAVRSLRATFTLRVEDGRALVTIADDGPRVHGSPLLGDPDHLSMLGGLRRARLLLERTQGLIRVEADEDDTARFELSVPLDPDLPRYRVLPLDGATIAVPAALLDEVIDAAGLLYETDESGESVDRGGRSVPLADLAFFVDVIVPARGPSQRIAILGSVEKRLGLGCDASGDVIETSELVDAPEGWEPVAYGGIEVDDEIVPVIDVKRLLALRFRLGEQVDIPGSHVDPHVDSFVPAEIEEPEEVDFEPEAPAADDEAAEELLDEPDAGDDVREFRTALLVNQSEFRRRDLARTLETLGLEVEVSEDLTRASKAVDDGGVDLLVTDLRLGQEGGESFHTLREKHPELTIVLTSSVAQQYAGELAEKTGAHRCWLDPYRKSDLDAVLRELAG